MKKLVLSIFIVAVSVAGAFAQSPAAIGQFVITNTSTTVPIQLVTTNLQFTSMTLIGCNFHQITNTSTVFIGFGNSSNQRQGLPIGPGLSLLIAGGVARGGSLYNASNIWLDVSTANDGVIVYYER